MICQFCKEEIQDGAIKCKHCGSMLTVQKSNPSVMIEEHRPEGSLALAIISLVSGILCLLITLSASTLEGDSSWPKDSWIGWIVFSSAPLILGIIGINTKCKGKGMAITGIVLGIVSILICISNLQ